MKNLQIVVCTIEPAEPFIYWVNGKATIETLTKIEGDLTESYKELILQANKEDCDLKFEASYVPDETQYGSGYGDVLHIPGYFDLTVIKKIPWGDAQ